MRIGAYAGIAIAVIVLIFGSIIFAASSEKVSSGTVAVVTRNGEAKRVEGPGRVWLTPGLEDTETYSTSVMNLEFTGTDSKARYTDTVITAKSKDGVDSNFAAMLYFQIPAENTKTLYSERGRSQDALVQQHVQVLTRDAARDVIEQSLIDEMYLGGMDSASKRVEEKLRPRFEEMGIELRSFDFTAIDPSDAYKVAIEQQVEQQQNAALEAEKVKVEEQKAEQKRVQAEGQKEADIIAAEGRAEANRIEDESLTPEIIMLRYYEALKTINWAILESPEGAQPTLPIETPEEAPEETPES